MSITIRSKNSIVNTRLVNTFDRINATMQYLKYQTKYLMDLRIYLKAEFRLTFMQYEEMIY